MQDTSSQPPEGQMGTRASGSGESRACEFSETLVDHRSLRNDSVWLRCIQPSADACRLVENSQGLPLLLITLRSQYIKHGGASANALRQRRVIGEHALILRV